jgi:Leucine Rich repeat
MMSSFDGQRANNDSENVVCGSGGDKDDSIVTEIIHRIQQNGRTTHHHALCLPPRHLSTAFLSRRSMERMCAVLAHNRTIAALELWLPPEEPTAPLTDANITDQVGGDYAFLTDMLARNDTIQRLTVLGEVPDKAGAAILAGLQHNNAISHLEWHSGCLDDPVAAAAAWKAFFSTTTTITACTWSVHSNATILSNAPMDPTKHSSLLDGLRLNRSLRALTVHQLVQGHVVADLLLALHDNASLTQLSLTECNVSTVQQHNAWPRLPALEQLRLAECQLTPTSLAAWSQSMQTSSTAAAVTLTRLDVRGNATFQCLESCRLLRAILQSTTDLQKLVLEQCHLNDAGLQILLQSNDTSPTNNYLTKLQSLSLRDNDLVSGVGLACATLPSLQKLDASDNLLGGEDESSGMQALVALIECGTAAPRLRHLVLESCQWTASQVRDLCRAIGTTRRPWRHLNLGCHLAVGHVMADIAALLDPPTSLQSLHLGSCGVTDHGVKELLVQRCLERDSSQCGSGTSRRLYDLVLPWNQIEAAGVAHLSRWIRHNPRHGLQTLNVAFNSFDAATGLEELVDALSYNCWMTKLQVTPFYGTGVVQTKMQQMHHWLRLNRAGRHHAVHQPEQVPTATWPLILARADQVYSVAALYGMLREAAPHWWSEL